MMNIHKGGLSPKWFEHCYSNLRETLAVNRLAGWFFGCSAQQLVEVQINKEYLGICLAGMILENPGFFFYLVINIYRKKRQGIT